MGNIYSSFPMIHFEDIYKNESILINTLPDSEQMCLIHRTIKASDETNVMNNCMKTNKHSVIVVYGKNYRDKTIIKKFNQLKKFGFTNVHIYFGGIFEWILLQDIYGTEHFKTDGIPTDILQYK